MEENDFNINKSYSLWFRGYSIKSFIEGIEKYNKYLEPHLKEGNLKLKTNYENNINIISWLSKELNSCSDEWDMTTINISGQTLSLIKSTLQYILIDLNDDRKKILESNSPKEATEAIDNKIDRIMETMLSGIMVSVPMTTIMGPLSNSSKKNETFSIIFDKEIKNIYYKLLKNNKPEDNDRFIDDACTTLEDRIRQMCSLSSSFYGEALFDKAFNAENGIIQLSDNKEEQKGFCMMYKGFFKAIKNPLSHKRQKDISKIKAKQIIFFSDYLICLLEGTTSNIQK